MRLCPWACGKLPYPVTCPLLTKLSATICAVLRARSLGLKTNDLSWDYAIAAIWGNLGLGVGAIAANMVLLRSYITFFRGRRFSTSPGTSAQTHTNTYSLARRGWTRQHDGIDRAPELGSAFEDDKDSQYGLTSRDQVLVQVTPGKSGGHQGPEPRWLPAEAKRNVNATVIKPVSYLQ